MILYKQEIKVIHFGINFVKIGIDYTKAVTAKRVDSRPKIILCRHVHIYFPVLFSLFN